MRTKISEMTEDTTFPADAYVPVISESLDPNGNYKQPLAARVNTLTGGTLASGNLGTFTSPLIDDNTTVKAAIESIGTNLAAVSGTTGDEFIGTVDGTDLATTLLNRIKTATLKGLSGPDPVPAYTSTSGRDDSDELEGLINDYIRDFARYVNKASNVADADEGRTAISAPALYLEPGRIYSYSRDMPAMPPGSIIRGAGAMVIPRAHNIRLFWTERTPTLPNVAGGDTTQYGNLNCDWELPIIHCNGYGGTFIDLDTWQRGRLGPTLFTSCTGTAYTVSGACTNGSNQVGVTPTDYAKVKKNDILDTGFTDADGNPWPLKVIKKEVINSGATDRTYGRLTLDEPVQVATGNVTISSVACPMVWSKVQQSIVERQTFIACDWSCYHGINEDDVGGTNDVHPADWCEDYCRYGMVWGRGSNDATFGLISAQYNLAGSHLFMRGTNLHIGVFRTEYFSVGGSFTPSGIYPGLLSKPAIVMQSTTSRLLIDIARIAGNDAGRYFARHKGDGTLLINRVESVTGATMPAMPDSSYGFVIKSETTGFVYIGSLIGITSPTVDSLLYDRNPYAWITNGSGGLVTTGYSVSAEFARGQAVFAGETRNVAPATSVPTYAVRTRGDTDDRHYVRGDGTTFVGPGSSPAACNFAADATTWYFNMGPGGTMWIQNGLVVNANQVVGPRGAAVADATGAGDVVAQLNTLLARLRAHGLIAT